ncbi:MAG: hypothetical protein KF704_02450 [Crocinitomicaceae bacterium]|nr:hypothetical protein [Crocinitomicaceae bacterium]
MKKNELLELLYKLKKEETLTIENRILLENTIKKLEKSNTLAELKEIALVCIRILNSYWNFFDE